MMNGPPLPPAEPPASVEWAGPPQSAEAPAETDQPPDAGMDGFQLHPPQADQILDDRVDLESLFVSKDDSRPGIQDSDSDSQARSIADAIRLQVAQKHHTAVEVSDNRFKVGDKSQPTLPASDSSVQAPSEEPTGQDVGQSAKRNRALIGAAGDRDAVARALIGFVRGHVPRASMFIVKKDSWSVGWELVRASTIRPSRAS